MQKMQETMAKIKAETDPEKRQQLMNEHMQTMQEGMQMMNMGNGMKGGKKMDKMDITKRMDMMEKQVPSPSLKTRRRKPRTTKRLAYLSIKTASCFFSPA